MSQDPKKPVAVRLSNGRKFIDAIKGVAASSYSLFPFRDAAGENITALVNPQRHQYVTDPGFEISK